MGATLNIWEDLLEDTSFALFAIHSQQEDYSLAYALNRVFGIRLRRMPKDLELDKQVFFPLFQWNDESNQREWTLVGNRGYGMTEGEQEGLFPYEPTRRREYLVPEKREVDFFLKLDVEAPELKLLSGLLSARRVITAYRLDATELKSKHNLIF